jgi:hypothetical protein
VNLFAQVRRQGAPCSLALWCRRKGQGRWFGWQAEYKIKAKVKCPTKLKWHANWEHAQHRCCTVFTSADAEKKANRGPRLTPGGLRPQHPQRDGTIGGNTGQHGTRAATIEAASSSAPGQQQTGSNQQGQPHQQQKLQPTGHSWQSQSTQQRKESEYKRTRSGKDPMFGENHRVVQR